jgi:nitroimidazol reductase NimA-like FMN-containing flavoprotein (pyridoxamine 5'-phosphate oxidase superfamily)
VLVTLDREDCERLLASQQIGRVAVNAPGWQPVIRPVNYRFDVSTRSIVFRSARGSKVTALLLSGVAAFEVDHIDEENETGWSVILSGAAGEVENPAEQARLEQLGLSTWASGDQSCWVRIRAETISGRRIERAGGV